MMKVLKTKNKMKFITSFGVQFEPHLFVKVEVHHYYCLVDAHRTR